MQFNRLCPDNYALRIYYAGVAELADALDLGSSGVICAGSSPVTRTIAQSLMYQGFGHFLLAKKNNHSKKAGA